MEIIKEKIIVFYKARKAFTHLNVIPYASTIWEPSIEVNEKLQYITMFTLLIFIYSIRKKHQFDNLHLKLEDNQMFINQHSLAVDSKHLMCL